MKNTICTIFIFLLAFQLLPAQTLPILKTTTPTISIKDGEELRQDYWSISPDIELDIYTADRTNNIKTVTFYSDIDSISFELKPKGKHDFIILLNGVDSCFTQIKSGISEKNKTSIIPRTDTIPFTLTSHNNISISAIFNEMDTVNLMFHTAVGGVSMTEDGVSKTTTLGFGESANINTWGGSSSARYSENNTLEIGSLKWENIGITEGKHSGPGTDGKFGPNLFSDKIIEIDYDNRQMLIHNLLPKMDSTYELLNLVFKQGIFFLEGKVKIDGQYYTNDFLVHSGYGGTILFDDEFVRTHDLSNQLEIIKESELKDSYGNVLKTQKAVLPALHFGQSTFSDIPVGIFAGAIARQKMSVMGGDVLKRFDIVFDLGNAHIYLKPNGLYELGYSDI